MDWLFKDANVLDLPQALKALVSSRITDWPPLASEMLRLRIAWLARRLTQAPRAREEQTVGEVSPVFDGGISRQRREALRWPELLGQLWHSNDGHDEPVGPENFFGNAFYVR